MTHRWQATGRLPTERFTCSSGPAKRRKRQIGVGCGIFNVVIEQLIARIRATPRCVIYDPTVLPDVSPYALPPDVEEFYRQCGGCRLFDGSDYAFSVAAPTAFRAANPVIVGEVVEDDISAAWYIVGQGGSEEYVTIDLHPARLGRCYDSFWDRHAVAGNSPIIAMSFTELLTRILENAGGYWYWLKEDFEAFGDAYDRTDV
jgi:hypothetical protein